MCVRTERIFDEYGDGVGAAAGGKIQSTVSLPIYWPFIKHWMSCYYSDKTTYSLDLHWIVVF